MVRVTIIIGTRKKIGTWVAKSSGSQVQKRRYFGQAGSYHSSDEVRLSAEGYQSIAECGARSGSEKTRRLLPRMILDGIFIFPQQLKALGS